MEELRCLAIPVPWQWVFRRRLSRCLLSRRGLSRLHQATAQRRGGFETSKLRNQRDLGSFEQELGIWRWSIRRRRLSRKRPDILSFACWSWTRGIRFVQALVSGAKGGGANLHCGGSSCCSEYGGTSDAETNISNTRWIRLFVSDKYNTWVRHAREFTVCVCMYVYASRGSLLRLCSSAYIHKCTAYFPFLKYSLLELSHTPWNSDGAPTYGNWILILPRNVSRWIRTVLLADPWEGRSRRYFHN